MARDDAAYRPSPHRRLIKLTTPERNAYGAGRTTAVRILATLTRPDAGTATVAGYDVTREPRKVRELIGLAGQHAAVDEDLTGRETLFILGLMHHLGRPKGRQRGNPASAAPAAPGRSSTP